MDDHVRRLEPLHALGPRSRAPEVGTQRCTCTHRGIADGSERVPDVGVLRVEVSQMIELLLAFGRRQPARYETTHPGSDRAHDISRIRCRYHQAPSRSLDLGLAPKQMRQHRVAVQIGSHQSSPYLFKRLSLVGRPL